MNIYLAIPVLAFAIYIMLFIILYVNRPWTRRHRLFALFLMGAMAWIISSTMFRSQFFPMHKMLLAQVTFCLFLFMLIPFTYFITTFYRNPRDNWLIIAYIPLLSGIVLSALGYLPESVSRDISYYPEYNRLYMGIFIALPFLVLAGRAVQKLVGRLRTAETALVHNQTIYLLFVIAIFGVSAASNLTMVGRQLPISHLGNLMIAILLTYSIIKHQLVDMKLFLRHGLVYLSMIIIVVVVFMPLLYLAIRFYEIGLDISVFSLSIAGAAIIVIVFLPLRNILEVKIEQLFYPKTYDYRQMLLDFSRKAGSILEIDQLGAEVTNLVAAALNAKRAYLLLFEGEGRSLVTQFVSMEENLETIPSFSLDPRGPVMERLRLQKKLLFRDDLNALHTGSGEWEKEMDAMEAAEIEVLAPLVSRDNFIGVMVLSRKVSGMTYDMGEIDIIGFFTSEIATAVENAQLHAEIAVQAVTDDLTRLFNRRHFDRRINEEIWRHNRYGGVFSLIMCDMDMFKVYNDTYGHKAGDKLLQDFAMILVKSVRSVDLVFRYGGDEFVLLLPQTCSEDACLIAERIRNVVAGTLQTGEIRPSISLGVASFPEDGAFADDLVKAADAALYHSKQAGGNRTSLYSGIASSTFEHQASDVRSASPLNTVRALITALNARDNYSGGHSQQVARFAVSLGRAAGLNRDELNVLRTAALLHDVGKIGIPDDLLNKTDALTPEEIEVFHAHSSIGVAIISHIPGLTACRPLILHHHERYDGQGYPDKLAGEEIPLGARIIAVADTFAAMISVRPYRSALSLDQAVVELKACRGTSLDPELVDLFIPLALSEPEEEMAAARGLFEEV